jgi:hypothetical protein
MTTYSIYFENQSEGSKDYAFFRQTPTFTGVAGSSQPYSNVFLTHNLVPDGNWTIDITETYYACMRVYRYVSLGHLAYMF